MNASTGSVQHFVWRVIEPPLLLAGKRSQGCRQGEGEQEVRHRQQARVLLSQPGLGLFVRAFGAMPVATRMVAVVHLVALGTGVNLPA